MKHIKIYEIFKEWSGEEEEKIQPKYNINGYVFLKNNFERIYDIKILVPYAKLLDVSTYKYYTPDYQAQILTKDNKIKTIKELDEQDILRYLSDEEIEKYKMLKTEIRAINKYNL